MNSDLFTNNHGLRLITEFEGAPRLTARLCEGGAWELGYGVTFYPDGSPVKQGDTCTPEKADAMFRHALGVFEDAVLDMVTVELNENQFSALVALCYNIGAENFRTSTVLREVNAKRFYDAAAAFGMWIFATKNDYKQALRGLLRRRYAEALLFLGYDWTVACDIDAIALQRIQPATLPGRDTVRFKTPFSEVLAVAQKYPLADMPSSWSDIVDDINTLDLTPSMQADPSEISPESAAGQPEETPSPPPAVPAQPDPAEPSVTSGPTPGGAGAAPDLTAPPAVAPPTVRPIPRPLPAPAEAKNPIKSQTIWGSVFVSMAPTFTEIGNMLMSIKFPPEIATHAGTGVFAIGLIMIILGRVGASEALSVHAPIRSQS